LEFSLLPVFINQRLKNSEGLFRRNPDGSAFRSQRKGPFLRCTPDENPWQILIFNPF
jgi:hypothetical protein